MEPAASSLRVEVALELPWVTPSLRDLSTPTGHFISLFPCCGFPPQPVPSSNRLESSLIILFAALQPPSHHCGLGAQQRLGVSLAVPHCTCQGWTGSLTQAQALCRGWMGDLRARTCFHMAQIIRGPEPLASPKGLD